MSLTTGILLWLAAGWFGVVLIWLDLKTGMFWPGWRLAVLCVLILLTGPLAILLALFLKLATALDRKKPWAVWLVQKRAR